MSASPAALTPETRALLKRFWTALDSFEADDVSLSTATKIRDATPELVEPLRSGLAACEPIPVPGMEHTTVLGLTLQSLSDLAFRSHIVAGQSADAIPTVARTQCEAAARAALRDVILAALDTQPTIRSAADPADDEFQRLGAMCAGGDTDLVERLVAAGIPLDATFVSTMDLGAIDRGLRQEGAFARELQAALESSDAVAAAEMADAIRRPSAVAQANPAVLADLHPVLRGVLHPVVIHRALVECVAEAPLRTEGVKALLDLGADPMFERRRNPGQPSVLWTALKDRHGVEAAKLLLERDKDTGALDLNECHGGQSLLARAASRRDDELIKILADRGAKFANPDEANIALVEAGELGMLETIGICLAQGAGIDFIDTRGPARTALIAAALHNKAEAVAALLEKGADPALRVRKGKMTREAGWQMLEHDFLEEAVFADSVAAVHAAGKKLGLKALTHLKPGKQSPKCREFLAAVQAKGAIPDQLPKSEVDMDKLRELPPSEQIATLLEAGYTPQEAMIKLAGGSDPDPLAAQAAAAAQGATSPADPAQDPGTSPGSSLDDEVKKLLLSGMPLEKVAETLVAAGSAEDYDEVAEAAQSVAEQMCEDLVAQGMDFVEAHDQVMVALEGPDSKNLMKNNTMRDDPADQTGKPAAPRMRP